MWKRILGISRGQTHPIGLDVSQQGIRMAQLADLPSGCQLVAASAIPRPDQIDPGTSQWQEWVTRSLRTALGCRQFRGNYAVAALGPKELVIQTIRLPRTGPGERLEDAIISRIRPTTGQKVSKETHIVRYRQIDQENVMVMVADRQTVESEILILESAGLKIKAIVPWPQALACCYARFFGRRQSDLEAVVMLIYLQDSHTELVICRHKLPLFARSIPLGTRDLNDQAERLAGEILACRQELANCLCEASISRVIFLSSRSADKQACMTIAKQLQLQSHLADCVAAVQVPERIGKGLADCGFDRRNGSEDWAMAFGLSLSC